MKTDYMYRPKKGTYYELIATAKVNINSQNVAFLDSFFLSTIHTMPRQQLDQQL